MNTPSAVEAHYTSQGMLARVETALAQSGMASGQIAWSDLAALDQFHVRGLAATRELAGALQPQPGQHILDIGSGLGGPARLLAAEYGLQVTGIELSADFVAIAKRLTERTGQSDRVMFVPGDALELPFGPQTFDHAWTQHVAMNIRDKARLYRGIHQVLKPGGRLAIYDAVRGDQEPVIYPLPWASDAAISFLASPAEMSQMLCAAGFAEVSAADMTLEARAWFTQVQGVGQSAGTLNLAQVIGPQARQMTANFARNLEEGRVKVLRMIVQKRI